LILVNTTKQFHSRNGDRGEGEALEPEHGSDFGLDATMILLDKVVEAFRRSHGVKRSATSINPTPSFPL
jgi:hypothetical protein